MSFLKRELLKSSSLLVNCSASMKRSLQFVLRVFNYRALVTNRVSLSYFCILQRCNSSASSSSTCGSPLSARKPSKLFREADDLRVARDVILPLRRELCALLEQLALQLSDADLDMQRVNCGSSHHLRSFLELFVNDSYTHEHVIALLHGT